MPVPNNTRKKPKGFRRFLRVLLVLGLAGGLAAGGAALWFNAEWSAKASVLDYRKLKEMESASLIFDRNGELLGRIFIQNRDQKPLSELSESLQKAVISAEDARFFQHTGVDFFGIARAITRNLQAQKARQGASTLTQQLARNSFPDELPSADRSPKRKILEMYVAAEIEKRLNKKQILELYLNRVFFGSGFYGAEAASQGYFGKSAKNLSIGEAALLAGLLRSPNNLSPWRNRRACIESRNHVLLRMRELKAISEADYRAALAEEPDIKNRRPNLMESYAADMVSAHMSKLVGLDSAASEGYRIYTTIDLSLQRKAEAALQKQLQSVEARPEFRSRQTYEAFDPIFRSWKKRQASGNGEEPAPRPEYLQGAVVVLDNHTGAIRAIVGGRDPVHSEFNRVTQARRPPGSAFLPLVFAAGFEQGLHPFSIVQDSVMDNRKVMVGGTRGILGEWAREQADTPYEGPVTARQALVKSKNAATVRFGMQIGDDLKSSLEFVGALAKASGIQSPLRSFPATFLGSSELTPLELALSYTMFPGGGIRPAQTFLVDRVEDGHGRIIYQANPDREKVISPGVAYQVHECLSAALSEGTGAQAFTSFGLKRMPVAGKTGTAYDFTDTWFVGYSSEITCAVWVGFDKPRTQIYYGAFGSDLALPVWTDIMNTSFTAYAPRELDRPAELHLAPVCSKSGLGLLPACGEIAPDGTPRSTSLEVWLTDTQRPGSQDSCDVHGPKHARRRPNSTAWPKVELAVDVSSFAPIALQSPTVLGEDPFLSTQSENTAKAIKNFKEQGQVAPLENKIPSLDKPEPDAPEVPRVQRVLPGESQEQTAPPLPSPSSLPRLEF